MLACSDDPPPGPDPDKNNPPTAPVIALDAGAPEDGSVDQSVNITLAEEKLQGANANSAVMVNCSHANSNKDFSRQPLVAHDVMNQILEGNKSIIGIMLESHLNEGNQPSTLPAKEMQYGVSITDACINWQTTEELLRDMAHKLKDSLNNRVA